MGFGPNVKLSVLLPVPELGGVKLIQSGFPVDADQVQSDAVSVKFRMSEPPPAG